MVEKFNGEKSFFNMPAMKNKSFSIYFTNLSVLLFVFLIASGCSKKNENFTVSAEASAETIVEPQDFYQWQIRKSPVTYSFQDAQEETYPLYEVYLYETVTCTKHFIFSRLDRSENFSDSSSSPLWYYEPGGSTSYSVTIENDRLKVIATSVSTGISGNLYSDEKEDLLPESDSVIFEMDTNGIQLEEKNPAELEIPQFTRTLERKENQANLYGDDIFYMQFIISQFFDSSIEIDGYYGKQTEQAIKKIQKDKGFSENGTVTSDFWKDLTDTKKYRF